MEYTLNHRFFQTGISIAKASLRSSTIFRSRTKIVNTSTISKKTAEKFDDVVLFEMKKFGFMDREKLISKIKHPGSPAFSLYKLIESHLQEMQNFNETDGIYKDNTATTLSQKLTQFTESLKSAPIKIEKKLSYTSQKTKETLRRQIKKVKGKFATVSEIFNTPYNADNTKTKSSSFIYMTKAEHVKRSISLLLNRSRRQSYHYGATEPRELLSNTNQDVSIEDPDNEWLKKRRTTIIVIPEKY